VQSCELVQELNKTCANLRQSHVVLETVAYRMFTADVQC